MSLARRSRLTGDPEKIRAWQQRSRENAAQRARERVQDGQERPKRKRKARIPAGVRAEVRQRSAGACVLCLDREGVDPHAVSPAALRQLARRGVIGEAAQLHHVMDEEHFPALAVNPANLIGLCPTCHYDHENFAGHGTPRRIPREVLPTATLALAEREGLGWYIDREYPRAT